MTKPIAESITKPKLISVIVPAYNESKNIPILYETLAAHIDQLPYRFEILLVDDGSRDDTADVMRQLARKDRRIRVIELSRNFGKEAATTAGLHRAHGDAAIMIDADMQMPPSLIGDFIQRWQDGAGAEVVVGVFASRNMNWVRRTGARIFYKLLGLIASTRVVPHATDYRLLDRKVINAFAALPEHNRMTRGLIDWLGFKRDYIYFNQAPRRHGVPQYSIKKLVDLAMNSFTTYSLVPLKFAGFLGLVILFLSIPGGIFLFTERFIMHDPFHWGVNGTTMLAALTLFLVGVILTCLGLMSMYIGHIHAEVKRRPLYVVRNDTNNRARGDHELLQLGATTSPEQPVIEEPAIESEAA